MEELSLKKVLGLYKQKLRFIICFVCIFTGIVAVYSFIMPVEYTSQASLFPPRQAESGNGLSSFLKNFSGGGGALSIGMVPQTNQGQVYAEIINSRGVAEYIIDKCN